MSSNKSQSEFKCSCVYAFGECVWPQPCEPKSQEDEKEIEQQKEIIEQQKLL